MDLDWDVIRRQYRGATGLPIVWLQACAWARYDRVNGPGNSSSRLRRMGLSTKDFWRLFADCRLRTYAESQQLCQRFAEARSADQTGQWSHATGAAKWLIAEGVVTRFQAKVLLAGRAGRFVYGPYTVTDRVTSGRLAGCFRAVHTTTGHPVVLWFMTGGVLSEPESYAAAAAQLAAACEVVHPCLSQTYQLVDLGDYRFVALEDLRGAAAEENLASDGRMPPREACRLMRQVALAAAALHARGIVHGDIRPQNVWIDQAGNGHLLQLPLSRSPHLPPGSPIEETFTDEERARAADYAAPELGLADQTPDALSDIYAIGCTTYQLLAGQAPFAGGSANGGVAEKMKRHATEAIQPLEPLGVPAELAKVVAFAMAKDRKLRYSSAVQLAEALAYFVPADELNIMPQPAPTFAAFEAWRTTNGRTPPPAKQQADEVAESADLILPEIYVPAERTAKEVMTPSPPSPAKNPLAESDVRRSDSDVYGPGELGQFTFAAASQTTSPGAIMRARQIRARNRMVYVMALLIALCIGGGIGFVVSNQDSDVSQPTEIENGTPESGGDGDAGTDAVALATDDTRNSVVTIPDDGQTLWAAPGSGDPIAWDYLPARAEIVLALRPAELLRHAEGPKIISSLGPAGARAWAAAEADIKLPLAKVEALTVAWSNVEGSWVASYVVRPAVAVTSDQLAEKWQGFQSKSHGAEVYFTDGSIAYAAPEADQGRRIVISSAALLPELLDAGPQAAPLRREILKLVQTSDSSRLATMLFTTDAVLVDSAPALAARGLERLHAAAGWMLREDVQAAAISLHLGENCYLEARLAASAQTTTPEKLAGVFRERMQSLAVDVEDYLSRIGLHPHGSKVLIRLGTMARFVEEQLRVGAEDDQVVINCYLPAVAAHNLVLAAELAISQPAGADAAPAVSTTPAASVPPPGGSASIAEKLRQTVSLSFERETLERAIQLLSAETGVPMEILGGDLQVEGITKNQSFKLQETDKPAAEILRKIMLLANPDGKLVYVVKQRPPGGEDALFITTRSAAQKRGDRLPPEVATAVTSKPTTTQE
jgi:serine/threonine protein kinase